MSYHAVLYSTPNCYKCKMTLKNLMTVMRVKEIHLFEGNDSWSEQKIEKFRAEGHSSFPVVRIYSGESEDTGERLDSWSDLQMGKLNQWKKKAEESVL